ncbi:IS110 family transposase [Albidovulum sp.]|uniref:IS110 family transposase n=1 Tax=Albidovulum sp. TaxID=1872424 RepID=UPI0039B885ED
MSEVTIIGVDLAKRVFHLHGARADGTVAYRKKLSRMQLLAFLSQQPCCIVAMETCATAHGWGREIMKLGHAVSLIPPTYVKPFVKRQKNDTADAEAIAEAASRPTMRFVAVKTEEQQARAMPFRTRQMFVRQRTQLINALRGHMAEYGVVAPQGPANIRNLAVALADQNIPLPEIVRDLGRVYVDQITSVARRIEDLDRQMREEARETQTTRRLQTMPGVGPVTAVAIETFAPPMETFRRGRDFAAWLGLVPRQHSSGGKPRLGKASKMGQRGIRRLLIVGAMAMIRATLHRRATGNSWLTRMLARKPRILVATALANKMARGLLAMTTKGGDYRDPAAATA